MSTLRDISRSVGFSVTTVSRALNGFPEVNEATRDRIVAAARALNYHPNQVARKLVSGRSGMIGLVLPAPPQAFEQGHFFEIISGLSEEFSLRGLDLVLHTGAGGDVLATHERLISRGALDGFVVTAPEVDDARIALLGERAVPFVVHGHQAGDDGYAYFDIDNRAVSALAVARLAELGHRRIGLLNGGERAAYARERLHGYREALAERGLPFDPRLVRHGDASGAYGARAASEVLADAGGAPTALVCCSAPVAAGALAEIRRRGLGIPQDVSVIAHDDDLPQVRTADLDPPLTVTFAPLRDSAAPLVDLLTRRIRGETIAALQITRRVPLIERASTAAPRG